MYTPNQLITCVVRVLIKILGSKYTLFIKIIKKNEEICNILFCIAIKISYIGAFFVYIAKYYMKIIKPKKLSPGDLIGIVSPASSPVDLEKINNGVIYLEKLGYKVIVGKHVYSENDHYAGNDSQRLDDFQSMFKNKDVKAIFCSRGGYGSGRLLNDIDYSLIKKNPKILVGYSDITALQLAILKKCGLVTFAGPMVAVDFGGEVDEFTEEVFWRTITSDKKIGKLANPDDEKFYVLTKGRGEGQLVGGNLSLVVSLMGTKYQPDFKDSILFLEEIAEPPYKIDRFFNQLRLANVFGNIKGLIFGRFVDCYDTDATQRSFTLNEVIVDYFEKLKLPVIYNVKHGHLTQNITLPIGLKCKINSSRGFIEINEAGVI